MDKKLEAICFDLDHTLGFFDGYENGEIFLRAGVRNTLKYLREGGYDLRLTTCAKPKITENILRWTGLEGYFNEIHAGMTRGIKDYSCTGLTSPYFVIGDKIRDAPLGKGSVFFHVFDSLCHSADLFSCLISLFDSYGASGIIDRAQDTGINEYHVGNGGRILLSEEAVKSFEEGREHLGLPPKNLVRTNEVKAMVYQSGDISFFVESCEGGFNRVYSVVARRYNENPESILFDKNDAQ